MTLNARFGILGPLEVRIDGEPLQVGGPRVQAVLAALMLQEGGEISADSLIDVVWGDDPPPTVRTSLQVHISRIRSSLAALGARDLLTTHGSAYVLAMAPDQLDAAVFRRRVSDGRALLGDGSVGEALEALAEALGLWRGVPLTGIELPGLAPGVLRELEDLRDLAVALHAEAELSLGMHAEALPNILRARAELPLDERVCELAALALYRSGRQADALAEVAALRRDLSEQLGMEPGPSVLELERRILAGDPSLTPVGPAREPPRELRKTVTVLALRLPSGDPEDVLAATKAVSDLFDGAVDNLGGWCPPQRSGRLLGVFGVPVVHEDDAERAIRTADALSRAATALGIEVRLGVSTGEVLVEIGDDVRLLTHDPVEVADLLARKARPGEILLGVATHRLVGAIASVDEPQLLVIDDEEAPLVAHRLRDVADGRAAPRLAAPLVGRENDLLRLRDAAQRAFTSRRPTMLAVLGPAGIGKSRLIQAFTAGLGDRVDVVTGRCLPYGRDVGIRPMSDIVREIIGIGGARPSDATRRLSGFLADEPDREALVELLGALVGIADVSSTRDETFWAIRRCFEIASRRQPLAVVLEDLQWAEGPLLDLVGYVASAVSDAPFVLACSARSERDEPQPAWGGTGADTMMIRLEPLTETETDALLAELLGSSDLAEDVRGRITAATEGNPLFLEEVLSILIDDGHLLQRDGLWRSVGDLSVVPIPPTVKALLDARVDRLSPAERDVLEAASIVGRGFDLADLADLRPESDSSDVLESLDSLCRRGLLDLRRFTRRGSSAYEFRHLLIRDVAYGAIPRERRARDHEMLGRALLDRAGDSLGETHEVIGYHLETAYHLGYQPGRLDAGTGALGSLAATHLAAAGRRAFALDDAPSAASLFARAMACVPDADPSLADLARLRGAALFDLGDFELARDVLSSGLDAATRSDDAILGWRLRLELMELDVYTRPEDRPAAEVQRFAEGAIVEISELGDAVGLARAHRLLGEALMLQGQLDAGMEAFELGGRYARDAGDEREVALPQRLMGLHGTTPLPIFVAHCEQLKADPARRPRPEVVMRLAFAQALMGSGSDAQASLTEGLRLAKDVGGAFRVADAELYAGLAKLHLGEAEDAAVLLESSAARLGAIGESNLRSTVEGELAEAWYRLGRLDDALAASDRCRELAADDDWASQMLWRQVRAKVLAVRGKARSALDLISEALEIAGRTDFLTMTAFVHLDAADVRERAGDGEGARRDRSLAASLLEKKGASVVLASSTSVQD